jgi:HD domain
VLGGIGSLGVLLDPSTWMIVWFLLAGLLLDVFDLSLPLGDSIGVAGALYAGALVVLGPLHASVIGVASVLVAHVLRSSSGVASRLPGVLVSRVAALAAGSLFLVYLQSPAWAVVARALVPGVSLSVGFAVAQLVLSTTTGRPLLRLFRSSVGTQMPLLLAQWSASVLLVLTYGGMGSWSLIPVVALLLLMRQSFALFLDIQETYRTTVEVLVEAAESQDARRIGHAERTAMLARHIAEKMGLTAAEIERIGYAALLHDLGELAAGDSGSDSAAVVSSAAVVHGAAFFDNIEPILELCDGVTAAVSPAPADLLAAAVVALSSDIDSQCHKGVMAAHRMRAMDRIAPAVDAPIKASVIRAARRVGYQVSAVAR